MNAIQLAGALPAAGRLGVLLGSFDPPHLGHEHLVGELLGVCSRVLVLVPARHFEKEVRPGENASFEQRLRMLAALPAAREGRVIPGLVAEVLYLRLAAALEELRPGCAPVLAMGEESFARLLASREYFAGLGLPWGAAEEEQLRGLAGRCLVFARGRSAPGLRSLPEALRQLASRRIRARARELWDRRAGADAWRLALGDALSPGVLALIEAERLYAG